MARSIPANSGRRFDALPVATSRGARVSLPVQSAQGRTLPSLGESMTADNAEQYALRILAAVAIARHEHAQMQRAAS